MSLLARAVAVAALAATPVAVMAAPAAASCTVVPIGHSEATYCAEAGHVCAAADTPLADAGACLSDGYLACYVDLPNRPLLVCV